MHLQVTCVSRVAAAALRKPSGLWKGCSNCKKSNYHKTAWNCAESAERHCRRQAEVNSILSSPTAAANELTAGSGAFSVKLQEVAKLTASHKTCQERKAQGVLRKATPSYAYGWLDSASCKGHIPFSELGCGKGLYLPLLLSCLHPDWPLLTGYDSPPARTLK